VRVLRQRTLLPLGATALLAVIGCCLAVASPDATAADGHVLFRMHDQRITESSSLVVSTVQPNVVYTANDSGDGAYIYSVDMRSGDTVGVATLAGVSPQDVEAMAPGPDSTLYFADIGDNKGQRNSITVYWFRQPGPGDITITDWHAARLKYPRGARNAETVLVNPATGELYVVSKQLFAGTIYKAPQPLSEDHMNHLRAVGVAPSVVTDGAFLPDGMVVLRTYGQAELLNPNGWRASTATKLPRQPQGESVAAIQGSDDILIGTEGSDSAVQEVALRLSGEGIDDQPTRVPVGTDTARPTGPTTSQPSHASRAGSTEDPNHGLLGRSLLVGTAIAVALLGLGGAILARTRRRTRC
jgi:hypothetical protein